MKVNFHYALVIATKDKSHLRRVQVRVLPEMALAEEAHLPWVRPFDGASFEPPAIGSPLWVIFADSEFKQGFFLTGAPTDDEFLFDDLVSSLDEIEGLKSGTKTEGGLRFKRFSDGSIQFHNPDTGEHGFYHSSGSYSVFKADGSISAYGSKAVKVSNPDSVVELKDGGDISIEAGKNIVTNGLELTYDGDYLVRHAQLKAVLDGLKTWLSSAMHTDPLSGVTGTFVLPWEAAVPTLPLDIEAMKSKR